MNPVPLMKLVEIVRGLQTSDATYEATCALANRFGKTPSPPSDMPGFIVNRMLIPLPQRGLLRASTRGSARRRTSTPASSSASTTRWGRSSSPTSSASTPASHRRGAAPRARRRQVPAAALLRNYVAAGWLGRKSGRGFYVYDARSEERAMSDDDLPVLLEHDGRARGGHHLAAQAHERARPRGPRRARRRASTRSTRGPRRGRASSPAPAARPSSPAPTSPR